MQMIHQQLVPLVYGKLRAIKTEIYGLELITLGLQNQACRAVRVSNFCLPMMALLLAARLEILEAKLFGVLN
jgi:hypothetical protein